MLKEISVGQAFELNLPIGDVRSPSEYSQGHINGAINIPLFTDAERIDLGIIYKQISVEKAIKKGFIYAKPKLQFLYRQAETISSNKKIILHCLRGGMRSREYAKHLLENGFKEVYIIKGGYKQYRKEVLDSFEKSYNIIILGGYTGSGKTFILKELENHGEQIIDLESLAKHKGSTFGGLGQKPQNTTEQFENDIFDKLKNINTNKPLWLEDESHNIGKNEIPHCLYKQMKNSKLIFIDIPRDERAKQLVKEYSIFDKEDLKNSILHIQKKLGGLNLKNAFKYLDEDNFLEVAKITLNYYDKSYFLLLQKRDTAKLKTIILKNTDHAINSQIILNSLK